MSDLMIQGAPTTSPVCTTAIPGEPPPEFLQLISLLVEPEVSLTSVDDKMGWAHGHCRSLLQRYPLLKRTVAEAKILAMKSVGLEKGSCYTAYAEALTAERTVVAGEEVLSEPDHKVRITAADRILTLYGENVTSPKVCVAVGVNVTNSEKEILTKWEVR